MKPSTVPTFDTNVTNITTPASGLLDDGYPDDDIPTAANFNWLFYWLGQWCAYIDAGIWDGDLEVDGNLSTTGDFEVDGTTTVEDINAATIVADAVVASAEVVASTFYHTEPETLAIPASLWFQDIATHTASYNQWIFAADTDFAWVPIQLPVGSVVVAVRFYAQKNTSNTETLGATVRRSLNGTDSAPPEGAVSLSNSDNAPGNVTLDSAPTVIDFEIETGYAYHLRLEPSGSVTPAADRGYLVEVDWTRPAP